MKVTIEPELAKRKPLVDLVEQANPVLEQVLGRGAASATAVWSFHSDETGHPVIKLTVSDELAGQGSTEVSRDLLQSPSDLRFELRMFMHKLRKESRSRILASIPGD